MCMTLLFRFQACRNQAKKRVLLYLITGCGLKYEYDTYTGDVLALNWSHQWDHVIIHRGAVCDLIFALCHSNSCKEWSCKIVFCSNLICMYGNDHLQILYTSSLLLFIHAIHTNYKLHKEWLRIGRPTIHVLILHILASKGLAFWDVYTFSIWIWIHVQAKPGSRLPGPGIVSKAAQIMVDAFGTIPQTFKEIVQRETRCTTSSCDFGPPPPH